MVYGGAFAMLVPGPIQSIEILINKSNTNKVEKTVCMVGVFAILVPGPIQFIHIIMNKSNTNKDNNRVCMVGCLYNVGAKGNAILCLSMTDCMYAHD